jgi:hypothetical protein
MSDPQKALETLCLKVCRDFLLSVVPMDVFPPGGRGNYTDFWILASRTANREGDTLSEKDQRRLLTDRTGETMRCIPCVWALFDAFLVSLFLIQGLKLVLTNIKGTSPIWDQPVP